MLSMNNKTEDKAFSLLKRAEEVEKRGQLDKAYDMYTNGLQLLLKAIKQAKTDSRKETLRNKAGVYMSHAEKLKEKLDNKQPFKKRITSAAKGKQSKKRQTGKVDAIYERIENEILDSSPEVQMNDVAGMENVKQALHESIVLPNLRPDIFTGLRAPPKGLLLFGPPGNGKTMIAKAVATECHACFFNMSASSLTSKFVGEGEKLVRALFEVAAERAPSIIFIDEIDSLLTSRGTANEMESSRRMKTEFLVQFDGVGSSAERILVIGATNLPWELDDAVIRRFTKRILVPLPPPATRHRLLLRLIDKTPYRLSNADMRKIVTETQGFSGSDLKALTSDAAMGPIREVDDITQIDSKNIPPVLIRHFLDSLRTIRPSSSDASLLMYDEWNNNYGSKIKVKKPPKGGASFSFSNLFSGKKT